MDASIRKSTSKSLYIFAWIVEVIAVTIGLGISLAVAYDGWISLTTTVGKNPSVYLNVLVAAAPFLLVAVVELTKIPLSGAAYYASRWYWKILFTMALIFVALVTFETMFNGLERQFSSLKYTVEQKMDRHTNLNEQRTDLSSQRVEAEKLKLEDIETVYNDRTNILQKNFNASVAAVDEKFQDEKIGTVSEYADMLRGDVDRLTAQLGEVKDRHHIETSNALSSESEARSQAAKELSNKRRSIQIQYENVTREIAELNRQKDNANMFQIDLNKRLAEQLKTKGALQSDISQRMTDTGNESSASSVSSDRAAMLRRHQTESANISRQLREVRESLALAIADHRDGRTSLNETILAEKAPLLAEYDAQRAEAGAMRDRQLADLKNREAKIIAFNQSIAAINSEITAVRDVINMEGRRNQVYRMAASLYDKDSIADLAPSEIAFVAAIWFGSLAAIVAFTGILLALGSYAVKTPPRDLSDRERLIFNLRKIAAAIKIEKRKPITIHVTEEVHVPGPERVVNRVVDREVEVIVTKYIPYPATPDELNAIANERHKLEPIGSPELKGRAT